MDFKGIPLIGHTCSLFPFRGSETVGWPQRIPCEEKGHPLAYDWCDLTMSPNARKATVKWLLDLWVTRIEYPIDVLTNPTGKEKELMAT